MIHPFHRQKSQTGTEITACGEEDFYTNIEDENFLFAAGENCEATVLSIPGQAFSGSADYSREAAKRTQPMARAGRK
jgi:hypothetical protein